MPEKSDERQHQGKSVTEEVTSLRKTLRNRPR